MATFTAPALGVASKSAGLSGQAVTVYAEIALTAAPALNDVFQMINIPNGARILGATLGADDIDTNGTPTVTLSLGDGGAAARYVSASTIGQTGAAPVDALLKTGYGYQYTSNDTIDITISAAAATFAAGTLRCSVTYIV